MKRYGTSTTRLLVGLPALRGAHPAHGTETGEEQEQPGAEQWRTDQLAIMRGKKVVGSMVFARSPTA